MVYLLDIFILILFVLSILFCCYQGFIRSTLTVAGILLGILLGAIFSPLISNALGQMDFIEVSLVSYTDGAEFLDESHFELARKPISQLTPEQIDEIIESGDFPHPLGALVKKNIEKTAFASRDVVQLGDYIALTFVSFFTHVLGFFIIFFVIFLMSIITIAVIDSATPFPILRRFDSLAGAGVGIVVAILLGMVLMLFIPIVLFMIGQQIPQIGEIVAHSKFAQIFYQHNFLFWFIRAN